MPALVRKLLIVAAADGLLLYPHKQQRPIPPIQINYVTKEISGAPAKDIKDLASFEAHGIAGLFTVASGSYLIAISSRKQVAQIKGKPIYVVTGVSLIPLSSQSEAKRAIEQSHRHLKSQAQESAGGSFAGDSSEDEEVHTGHYTAGFDDDLEGQSSAEDTAAQPRPTTATKDSSIAQDVIGRKGQYGRFAERWFSKKGWTADKRRLQGMSIDTAADPSVSSAKGPTVESRADVNPVSGGGSKDQSSVTISLLPKLLRTTRMLLSSHSFYFSYDYDITRRFGTSTITNTEASLHKLVDPLFFWNRILSLPLSDAGQHAFVLPLMQGFVGQKAFMLSDISKDEPSVEYGSKDNAAEAIELRLSPSGEPEASGIETKDYLLTLVSRRSVLRPGLRYLRRGVDEEGHVANAVETEQVLSNPAWTPKTNVYSFTQIRGSIPLFFSQSPYSFKPVPVLQQSFSANHAAFRSHFSNLAERYGQVQIAMLVDKHGTEAKVGDEFERHSKQFNESPPSENTIGFEWFDFHKMCAGMKFENVNILMETLKPALSTFGMTIENDGKIQELQKGVLRTNCMDCLDRTNVVQSAAAQRALEAQLAIDGITLDLQSDTSTKWFNALWADNGDAISRQYSSTAALKGDFTRTRKRDYRGAINDFGLTLTRYYNNVVNDYFSQAVIDYLLGNVTDAVFEEFESNMMSADPGVSMKRIRQNAIDTSAKIVIANDTEELSGGWTLATPHTTNTLRSFPFEEIVVLLTDAAIYAVRFDWNTEKVASFERIDICSIVSARQGVYITNTLTSAQMDTRRNVGLVLGYRPDKHNLMRVNTRSMHTGQDSEAAEEVIDSGDPAPEQETDMERSNDTSKDLRLLALKALPAQSIVSGGPRDAGDTITEKQLVDDLCSHITAVMGQTEGWVEDQDIISLAEAKRSTGLFEQWGHSLKKLVWA